MKKIEFQNRLEKIYTKEELKIIENGMNINKRRPTFRINTLKTNSSELLQKLKAHELSVEKIPFLKHGYFLNATEKDVWDTDLFKYGEIYLQSLASQLPVEILKEKDISTVLDITAAPGGKTAQIQAYLNNKAKIVAVDNNAIRIEKLQYTLSRQGVRNVKVIKQDAREDLGDEYNNFFDLIIADLPCSAEGKFNFNKEKSYSYWTEAIIRKNAKLQKQILKAIIPKLAPGGILLYSTCTLAPEENEDIVHFLLCNYPELELETVKVNYKYARNGIASFENKVFKKEIAEKVTRILPSEESEGFFIAKIKKKS